jgi:hypothetical protein
MAGIPCRHRVGLPACLPFHRPARNVHSIIRLQEKVLLMNIVKISIARLLGKTGSASTFIDFLAATGITKTCALNTNQPVQRVLQTCTLLTLIATIVLMDLHAHNEDTRSILSTTSNRR